MIHMIHKIMVSMKVVRVPSMLDLSAVEKIDKASLLRNHFRSLKKKRLKLSTSREKDLKREIQSHLKQLKCILTEARNGRGGRIVGHGLPLQLIS